MAFGPLRVKIRPQFLHYPGQVRRYGDILVITIVLDVETKQSYESAD